jgi:hypothetical protein
MAQYEIASGLVDEITLPEFGPATHYEAAEIVSSQGMRAAIFREPQARTERSSGEWSDEQEQAFREAVREVAHDLDYQDGSNDNEPYSLVFDPARDQAEEEIIDV